MIPNYFSNIPANLTDNFSRYQRHRSVSDSGPRYYTRTYKHFHSVTPILISRFILNLRQIGVDENGTTEDAVGSRFSTPAFRAPTLASIVGNIGEDLHHGPEEEVNGATDEDEPEHDNIIADGEIVTSRVASQHCGCSGDREQVWIQILTVLYRSLILVFKVPGSNVSLV